jgi:glyoxylase-like metal-dependent hydrolase (beta-lactamase superfamily II)
MKTNPINRRGFLKSSVALSGLALSSTFLPRTLYADDTPAPDVLAAFRKNFGSAPIEKISLGANLTLLMGCGGNIVVSDGKDGKIVIDTFVQPAWSRLKDTLDALSPNPVTQVIDTHWHFDHTDNNASFRALGAHVLSHEKTPIRMKETHSIATFNIHFPPSPDEALPTQTFSKKHSLKANGEKLHLEYVPAAHTDTDILIHFPDSNLIHCGDLLINNGGFPLIDYDSGGKIGGMIAASDLFLSMADDKTRLITGHGGICDKAYVVQFRDRLSAIRDRVAAHKNNGKSLEETIAAKPLEEFNSVWGHGFITADQYTEIVYRTL